MKYIANPVEVDAFVIIQVAAASRTKVASLSVGDVVETVPAGFLLRLDNHSTVHATPEMCARMMPTPGDYWVVQSDGYVYLNPKKVFEEKYSPKPEMEVRAMPAGQP